MRGGYQIIDFSTLSAFDGTETLPGAYAKAKRGRAILCENVLGTSAFSNDVNVADDSAAILPFITLSGGSAAIYGIVISSTDTVEVTAI